MALLIIIWAGQASNSYLQYWLFSVICDLALVVVFTAVLWIYKPRPAWPEFFGSDVIDIDQLRNQNNPNAGGDNENDEARRQLLASMRPIDRIKI